MLNPKEAQKIKEQILKQIDQFPPEQRDSAKEQILAMNEEELEEFLIQNKLIKSEQFEETTEQQCIFCSIRDGKIPSHKVFEDAQAIAVLDIHPQSQGHTIIIPASHIKDIAALPDEIFEAIKLIAENIQEKLSPIEIKIVSQQVMNHLTIHLIPQYKEGNRLPKEISEEFLENISQQIYTKKQIPKVIVEEPKIIQSEPDKYTP